MIILFVSQHKTCRWSSWGLWRQQWSEAFGRTCCTRTEHCPDFPDFDLVWTVFPSTEAQMLSEHMTLCLVLSWDFARHSHLAPSPSFSLWLISFMASVLKVPFSSRFCMKLKTFLRHTHSWKGVVSVCFQLLYVSACDSVFGERML